MKCLLVADVCLLLQQSLDHVTFAVPRGIDHVIIPRDLLVLRLWRSQQLHIRRAQISSASTGANWRMQKCCTIISPLRLIQPKDKYVAQFAFLLVQPTPDAQDGFARQSHRQAQSPQQIAAPQSKPPARVTKSAASITQSFRAPHQKKYKQLSH